MSGHQKRFEKLRVDVEKNFLPNFFAVKVNSSIVYNTGYQVSLGNVFYVFRELVYT